MTPDEKKSRMPPEDSGDKFIDDIRAKLSKHAERAKKKGVDLNTKSLTIIRLPKKEGVPTWQERTAEIQAERVLPPRPGPHPRDLIHTLVKEHLAPFLKALGFKKKAKHFWRDHGEIIDVISIYSGEFNDAWEGSFTIELGVYWKEHQRKLGGIFALETLPPRRCLLRQRLTPDFDNVVDHWWKFKPDVDLTQLAEGVISDIKSRGLPWLKSRHNPKFIREVMKERGERLAKIGILLMPQKKPKPFGRLN